MARPIRINGREAGVIRSIGFGLGISGTELQERLQMDDDDMTDILNTLLNVGYIETATNREKVALEDYRTEMYEVNPSYAADLKAAIRR